MLQNVNGTLRKVGISHKNGQMAYFQTEGVEFVCLEGSFDSVPVRHLLEAPGEDTWKSSSPKIREKNSCLLRLEESDPLIGGRVTLMY